MDVLRAVGCHVQVMGLSERRHLHPLRDATEHLGVGIQNRGRVVLDQVAEAIAGVLVLAGGDRNRGLLCEFAGSLVVVWGDRLLEPEDVEFFDTCGELNCLV